MVVRPYYDWEKHERRDGGPVDELAHDSHIYSDILGVSYVAVNAVGNKFFVISCLVDPLPPLDDQGDTGKDKAVSYEHLHHGHASPPSKERGPEMAAHVKPRDIYSEKRGENVYGQRKAVHLGV